MSAASTEKLENTMIILVPAKPVLTEHVISTSILKLPVMLPPEYALRISNA